MPHSEKIPEITLPMVDRFYQKPDTRFVNSRDAIQVHAVSHPPKNYKEICYNMIKATWSDYPLSSLEAPMYTQQPSEEELHDTFLKLLKGETLPNSMEALQFVFCIDGITLQEVTHILRHRTFFSIHAQCSGDLWWSHHSAMIPNSIDQSKFAERYKQLTQACKQLYCDMIDSDEISIMDARYILPRNLMTFYYVGMNLKDAIAFINQRKCTQIQPETDNILAHQIYELIANFIPEIREVVSMQCNTTCHYVRTANTGLATNLYLPDKTHDIFDYNKNNFIYQKTRKEMGSIYDADNLQKE